MTILFGGLRSNVENEPDPWRPIRMDWWETREMHVIRAEVTGITENMLKVEKLIIDGENNDETIIVVIRISGLIRKSGHVNSYYKYCAERRFGKFVRSLNLPLPRPNEASKEIHPITVALMGGLLKIVVFKEQPLKPHAIYTRRYTGGDSEPELEIPIDWTESPEKHVITSELPGYSWDKDIFRLDVERDKEDGDRIIIKISGLLRWSRSTTTLWINDKWHLSECKVGKFVRWLKLPPNTHLGGGSPFSHSIRNGVLTITVWKKSREPKTDNWIIAS